jgi:hypothetical protein
MKVVCILQIPLRKGTWQPHSRGLDWTKTQDQCFGVQEYVVLRKAYKGAMGRYRRSRSVWKGSEGGLGLTPSCPCCHIFSIFWGVFIEGFFSLEYVSPILYYTVPYFTRFFLNLLICWPVFLEVARRSGPSVPCA